VSAAGSRPPPDEPAGAALSLRNIDKRFPGVRALDHVSLHIRPNEVVGLIGENGAGKSTLMRILAGVYQPDSGEVLLGGKPVRISSSADAMSKGIGMVFQEQSLLPNLSVGENIYLGNEDRFSRLGLIHWGALFDAAKRQLAKVEVGVDPRLRAADLDFATRQMVELAKALTLEELAPGHQLVILLDEPTSVLEREDIAILFRRVRALKSRAAFVFVSHRLEEVLEISDRVYVMKDGKVVAEALPGEADVATLHRLMVGRDQHSEYYREQQQAPFRDEVVVEADRLGLAGAYRDVSFKLHKGEILGIAGVIGSGREELSRTLAGLAPHDGGRLTIDGREAHLASPADAVDQGIGYLPRERRTEGLVLFLSVAANITLPDLPKGFGGLIDTAAEQRIASDWVRKLGIKTPGIETLCLGLSGGNQQKVVLAKWLQAKSRILILDHPTRGLDVGAKEEVYELVRAVCAQGIAVILTSDTLEETIGLSHNVLVMRDGEITQRVAADPGAKPRPVDLIGHMV
jgi:ribose transport system ATP-binding protein